jgi:hypothetical protein
MGYGIMGDMAINYSLSNMKFSIFPLRDNLEPCIGAFGVWYPRRKRQYCRR